MSELIFYQSFQFLHANIYKIHFLFLRATAATAVARLRHHNCVRPSHGWIRQKRWEL